MNFPIQVLNLIWYTAPKIVNTFLESIDTANKTIILFATSGGSGLGNTAEDLKKCCDSTTRIISGKILSASQDISSLKQWAKKILNQ